jgi:hypothetical protein
LPASSRLRCRIDFRGSANFNSVRQQSNHFLPNGHQEFDFFFGRV